MPDISKLCHKLIGISFLQDEEEKAAHSEWTARFQEKDAFWVDASQNRDEFDIMKDLIAQMGKPQFGGANVFSLIVVAFYDLTHDLTQENMDSIQKQTETFQKVQGYIINKLSYPVLCLQSAYVGGMPSRNVESLKKGIVEISGKGIGRLILIASDAFSEQTYEPNWKALMLLLDMCRRLSIPDTCLAFPAMEASNKIGYIQYQEYSSEKIRLITEKINRIENSLSDAATLRISETIQNWMVEVRQKAKDTYLLSSEYQPYHPDMIVEEDSFFKRPRAKAKKGTLESYNLARDSTEKAVEATCARQNSEMKQALVPSKEEAAQKLRDLIFDDIPLGYVSKLKGVSGILAKLDEVSVPRLDLKYNESGPGVAFQAYMDQYFNYSVYQCQQEYLETLDRVFKDSILREIEKKIPELECELRELQNERANLYSENDFLGNVQSGLRGMSSNFKVSTGHGQMRKYFFYRTPDEEKRNQIAESMKRATDVISYYINENTGSLKNPDDAGLKTIHVFFADPSEADHFLM